MRGDRGRPMRGRGSYSGYNEPNALPAPSYYDDFYVQPRTRGHYAPMGDVYDGRPQRGMRSRGRAMRGNRGGAEDIYQRDYMQDAPYRSRGGPDYGDQYYGDFGGYRGGHSRGGYNRGRGGDFGYGGRGRGASYNDLDGFDRLPPRRGGFRGDN